MAREACGIEKKDGEWSFVVGKSPIQPFDSLDTKEKENLSTESSKRAVLAQRASLLDQRWERLADAISVISIWQSWKIDDPNYQSGAYSAHITDARVKAFYICNALKEESNS